MPGHLERKNPKALIHSSALGLPTGSREQIEEKFNNLDSTVSPEDIWFI